MPTTYERKTNNPNLGWTEERRKAWSVEMRRRKANGTWFKKSAKEVGDAISIGLKKAKRKQRHSEAMKKAWEKRRNGNGNGHDVKPEAHELAEVFSNLNNTVENVTKRNKWLDYPYDEYQVVIDSSILEELKNILTTVNEHFGIECTLNEFINKSLKDKVEKLSRFNN